MVAYTHKRFLVSYIHYVNTKVDNSGKSHIVEKQYGKVKGTNSSKSSKNKKRENHRENKTRRKNKTKKDMQTYYVLNADPTFTSDSICWCFGNQSPAETVGGEGRKFS